MFKHICHLKSPRDLRVTKVFQPEELNIIMIESTSVWVTRDWASDDLSTLREPGVWPRYRCSYRSPYRAQKLIGLEHGWHLKS